jgi:hypothetical protein
MDNSLETIKALYHSWKNKPNTKKSL